MFPLLLAFLPFKFQKPSLFLRIQMQLLPNKKHCVWIRCLKNHIHNALLRTEYRVRSNFMRRVRRIQFVCRASYFPPDFSQAFDTTANTIIKDPTCPQIINCCSYQEETKRGVFSLNTQKQLPSSALTRSVFRGTEHSSSAWGLFHAMQQEAGSLVSRHLRRRNHLFAPLTTDSYLAMDR